jgi:integrase/recombinase XerD
MGRPTGKVDRVVVAGPLAPFAEGFKARLEELGYTPLSTATWMRLMVHLSRWLGARGLMAADLSSQRVEQYLHERQAGGYARFLSPRSVAVLLGFLSSVGVLAPEGSHRPCSESEALLALFRDYLLNERGLAPSTAQAYVLRADRGEPPRFRIPDPIRSGPGTEDDLCENGVESSRLSSKTRP